MHRHPFQHRTAALCSENETTSDVRHRLAWQRLPSHQIRRHTVDVEVDDRLESRKRDPAIVKDRDDLPSDGARDRSFRGVVYVEDRIQGIELETVPDLDLRLAKHDPRRTAASGRIDGPGWQSIAFSKHRGKGVQGDE